jgi:hypothetical protein
MGTSQPANVDIILTPDPSCPDGIRFDMQSPLKNGNELVFKNPKKDDWFDVVFTIVDDQNTGYLFPDDKKKAMFVRPVDDASDPCPDDWDNPEYWDQFEAKTVTGNNRSLRVRNHNETVQLFKFCLWFTKTPKDDGPCIAYDPIGSNQNGTRRSTTTFSSTTTTLAIGAAVVAVLVVGYTMLMK